MRKIKFLLTAVNAKYIHSNLGIYSLKSYAQAQLEERSPELSDRVEIELLESTINNQIDEILKDIYNRKPDAVGFSCYIWNIRYVYELLQDIKKVLPKTEIWLGGPEVSFHTGELLKRFPQIKGIMIGEGEETFYQVIKEYCVEDKNWKQIEGIALQGQEEREENLSCRPVMDMDRIPFSYGDLSDLEHKIIYYESSRGCPFSCSYCLSSIDKTVRFRSLELVKRELGYFLERKVPQVKFVDRTFNCRRDHALAIWYYLLEHDNGITNFHFEISADLLGEEELELMSRMRPGLIQLEIGVQTTNLETIREIRRKTDLKKLRQVVERINSFGNIHQHLDLIAGLPYEDYESFRNSFNDVYRMEPEQLQLGFLKVLKGSYIEEKAADYELVYKSEPPYEVLSTKWIGYDEILKLKAVEDMVKVYYNSGQFSSTVARLADEFDTPFDLFYSLADFYEQQGLFGKSHSRLARYEILFEFLQSGFPALADGYRDSLMHDLYLRENIKSRPGFARDQSPYKEKIRDFFIRESKTPQYLMGYEKYDSRQISKMAHLEVYGDGSCVLYDYFKRDPLTYNARSVVIHGL